MSDHEHNQDQPSQQELEMAAQNLEDMQRVLRDGVRILGQNNLIPYMRSRELSLAITNFEQGSLWPREAVERLRA